MDTLQAFAARTAARCPAGIDPHHFGSKLSGCQYLAIAREVDTLADPGSILDWGTGFGHVAFLLASLGRQVEAFDVIPAFRDVDAELLKTPGVQFRLGAPNEPLPYDEGQFRTVISVGTLEHCDDASRALQGVRRVLSPGGRYLVYHLPNRWSWIELLARRTGRFFHERAYRPREARRLLAHHGFRVERLRPFHLLPRSSFSRSRSLRALSERHYRRIDALDGLLSRLFPMSLVATAFTIHARRA